MLGLRFVRCLLPLGVLVLVVGCSGDDTSRQVAAKNTSNIQRLANMYAAFQNMKSSAGPKDEAEFKDFVTHYAVDKLQMMGFDAGAIDKAFVSERDSQPFKIRYKVGGGRGSVAPVVFEATGKDGKKQVAFTGGTVEDVDDAKYQEYWAGKSGTTAPGAPATAAGPAGKTPGRSTGAPVGAPTGPPKA